MPEKERIPLITDKEEDNNIQQEITLQKQITHNHHDRKSRLTSCVSSGAVLFAVVFVSVLLAYTLPAAVLWRCLGQNKEVNLLTILIMSARGNFAQRQAVRNTWMSTVSKERVKTVFVIGQPCMIHPEDRIDEFSCVEQKLPTIDQIEVIDGWAVSPSERSRPVAEQFKFTVLNAIVLTELTLYELCAPENDHVTISIHDRTTQSEVVKEKVTAQAAHLMSAFTLPQGFEGLITIEGRTNCTHSVFATYSCSPFISCIREANVEAVPVVGFRYRLGEKTELVEHLSRRNSRHTSWHQLQEGQEKRLDVERDKYNDILKVNSVDVYRNLPDKLLLALHWANTELSSMYVMKADDDCYINTTSLLYKLDELNTFEDERNLWLGNFRKDWALDDYGKWAEHMYTGLTYPWFACGSGYVISADIAAWLSTNRKQLNRFQGEDVSMGIWLSALSISYTQYDEFICTKERGHMTSFTSLPELTPDEMRSIHHLV